MIDVNVLNVPHAQVCRSVVRIEIDGVLVSATTLSWLDDVICGLQAQWGSLPRERHPTIAFHWNPVDFANFFDGVEGVALH